MDVGNDDPLWRDFAEKESLDYLVPGYKAASLDFSRGPEDVSLIERLGHPAFP